MMMKMKMKMKISGNEDAWSAVLDPCRCRHRHGCRMHLGWWPALVRRRWGSSSMASAKFV
jgi:hypothetical protein